MQIVLVEPQIPQNTGSIARLAADDAALSKAYLIDNGVTDSHLQRLAAALATNTHLRKLQVKEVVGGGGHHAEGLGVVLGLDHVDLEHTRIGHRLDLRCLCLGGRLGVRTQLFFVLGGS